jgi:hypothetical protein
VPEARYADEHAERVGYLVAEAFQETLGERLACLAVHGSGVTGYIAGLSDFDFVVFMHGRLTLDDSIALQSLLGDADIAPFTYLQVSRVVNLDDPGERHTGLIDNAYVVAAGAIPEGWAFHDADVLRERGRDVLRENRGRWHSRNEYWSVEGGIRRSNLLRGLMTIVKPAVRALLVEYGEPVLEVWTSPYPELARRLRRYDAAIADGLEAVIASFPIAQEEEQCVGGEVLRLLDEIGARAEALGMFEGGAEVPA